VSDVRVLCRWPEWQCYREALLKSGRVDEERLKELELYTEADSLDVVEIIIGIEEATGVEYVERPKGKPQGAPS
jgi:hypothetical protein